MVQPQADVPILYPNYVLELNFSIIFLPTSCENQSVPGVIYIIVYGSLFSPFYLLMECLMKSAFL